MKKCNIHYIRGDLFIFKCQYLRPNLEDITNLEILPYLLHFSEVLKRKLSIKSFVG